MEPDQGSGDAAADGGVDRDDRGCSKVELIRSSKDDLGLTASVSPITRVLGLDAIQSSPIKDIATSFIDGKTVLHNPIPSLPDETLLDAVALSTRLRNVFKYNDLKTVGDVREASDATLRSFQDFGRGSLVYIREAFGRPQCR